MHSNNFIHRDLKPENILITKNGTIVLSDLGTIRKLDNGKAQTIIGTPCYMALNYHSSAGYDKSVDLYSLGCIIYTECTLEPPPLVEQIVMFDFFGNGNPWQIPDTIYNDKSQLQTIVNYLVAEEQDKRWKIEDLLNCEKVIEYNYKSK